MEEVLLGEAMGLGESFCTLRMYLRALYARITGSYASRHFTIIVFMSGEDPSLSFERHFSAIGWKVTKPRDLIVAESELHYPIAFLISSLITVISIILVFLIRTIDVGVFAIIMLFVTLTLYSLRPTVVLFKTNGSYALIADTTGHSEAIAFVRKAGGEVRVEKSVVNRGTPLHNFVATLRSELKAEVKTTAPLALKGETELISASRLEEELRAYMQEAEKIKNYLERLEEMMSRREITETAYQQLKREYTDKLVSIEAKIRGLKETQKKLEEIK